MAVGDTYFQNSNHCRRGLPERARVDRRNECEAFASGENRRNRRREKPPVTYSFKVKDVTENRMGAKLVPQYLENVTAPSQYELLEMVKIRGFIDRQKGLGRPTKKEGRELSKFTEDAYSFDEDDFDFSDDFLMMKHKLIFATMWQKAIRNFVL